MTRNLIRRLTVDLHEARDILHGALRQRETTAPKKWASRLLTDADMKHYYEDVADLEKRLEDEFERAAVTA